MHCSILYNISSTPPAYGPLASLIDHGCCFRCVNGALWSILFHCTGIAGISGYWSTLSAKVLTRGVVFATQ